MLVAAANNAASAAGALCRILQHGDHKNLETNKARARAAEGGAGIVLVQSACFKHAKREPSYGELLFG
jgi:hypothetical protein